MVSRRAPLDSVICQRVSPQVHRNGRATAKWVGGTRLPFDSMHAGLTDEMMHACTYYMHMPTRTHKN